MKYKQLKDLPYSDAGAIWEIDKHKIDYFTRDVNELSIRSNLSLAILESELVEQNKEFFIAIEEKPEQVKKIKSVKIKHGAIPLRRCRDNGCDGWCWEAGNFFPEFIKESFVVNNPAFEVEYEILTHNTNDVNEKLKLKKTMKLTEEQKEVIRRAKMPSDINYVRTDLKRLFPEAFDEKNPEREFIDVRIEWKQKLPGEEITASAIQSACIDYLNPYYISNISVTEIRDAEWSDEEMMEFGFRLVCDYGSEYTEDDKEEATRWLNHFRKEKGK